MFSPQKDEGAKPIPLQGSPSTLHETFMHDEEEHAFDLVDLEDHDDHENLYITFNITRLR